MGRRLYLEAGKILRGIRVASGKSQAALAAELGLKHSTYVSQIESGYLRIAPEEYRAWAKALKVDVREMVVTLFPLYRPKEAEILLGIIPLTPLPLDVDDKKERPCR